MASAAARPRRQDLPALQLSRRTGAALELWAATLTRIVTRSTRGLKGMKKGRPLAEPALQWDQDDPGVIGLFPPRWQVDDRFSGPVIWT
jgi:hypothetical protein